MNVITVSILSLAENRSDEESRKEKERMRKCVTMEQVENNVTCAIGRS